MLPLINIGATFGILTGTVIGFIITGPWVLIPFIVALILYNHPSLTKQRVKF